MNAERPQSVAEIVVDVPSRDVDRAFDYSVPAGMAGVAIGAPVLIPFGPRRALGYVTALKDASEHPLKPVEAVLGEPLFLPSAPRVAEWVATEYLAPLSEALRLFLPPGGSPRLEKRLASGPGEPTRTEWGISRPRTTPLTRLWAARVPGSRHDGVRTSAVVMRAVLDVLDAGPAPMAEIVAELGGQASGAVRRLERLGLVTVEERRHFRDPHVRERHAPFRAHLSDGQRAALDAISSAAGGDIVVLDGVTGSGKTEVYLQAVERALERGHGAIVLIPEISLTPQTVGRFRSRLGARVAVLHSRLSAGERYDQWELARRGEARVVVGARSALFAPVRDLALVIIDEEHEPSYKQASSPRYHARDVARTLCAQVGAPLVLGSATPSMESLHACETGRALRVALPERVGGGTPPEIVVADMTAEFADGHRGMFSRPLASALEDAGQAGGKAVLFLNRRGFASFLLCRECGFVPGCASCSSSLTFHQEGKVLACHHCGSRTPVPPTCPRCSSPYLRLFGAGTQRVEAELQSLVPGMTVVRMDADTVARKGGHERRLAEFEALESGILLGTQMVAKGLDYPEVTLVGVINADTTLHFPDFRASERTFQLLEQVAGRAGRGETPGRVVIQTYWPDHPAIRAVAERDPAILYREERRERTTLGYPPYGRLAVLTASGPVKEDVVATARELAARLVGAAPEGFSVLGPSPALLWRLKGAYRWQVTLKAPEAADAALVVARALDGASTPPGVTIVPDVDPIDV